ncbi:MAG TPA: hypothetical protein VJ789_11785 [Burkholderiales bacterium]|jgi:hypothetical protein|nr:hypothetical protein [Burkholderiales bacterium]
MKLTKLAAAIGLQASLLSGCYVVPVTPDGQNYAIYIPTTPPPPTFAGAPAPQPAAYPSSQPPAPKVLHARLYPENDIATQTGMVSGTVTNMMTGKGRFQLQYAGELLTGEATRVSGDDRKGIASAWGPSGAFLSCEYQMSSPLQGAGTCNFSNGARYKVHIGN